MIEINRRSTKAIRKDGLQLHYRQEEDIYRLVHYVVNGNMQEVPIYAGGKGLHYIPRSLQSKSQQRCCISSRYIKSAVD